MFSADKLARVMRERKMTASDLSRAAKVTHQYVQQLLRGEVRMPRQPYMDKLTEALGVPESALVDYPEREEDTSTDDQLRQIAVAIGGPNADIEGFIEWVEVWHQYDAKGRKKWLETMRWSAGLAEGTEEGQAQQG